MFDLALFCGLSSEQNDTLARAMSAADLRGKAKADELRRLRSFASTRADMDADPPLRVHLTTIAEGRVPFLGYNLALAAFGVTLDPVGQRMAAKQINAIRARRSSRSRGEWSTE